MDITETSAGRMATIPVCSCCGSRSLYFSMEGNSTVPMYTCMKCGANTIPNYITDLVH